MKTKKYYKIHLIDLLNTILIGVIFVLFILGYLEFKLSVMSMLLLISQLVFWNKTLYVEKVEDDE